MGLANLLTRFLALGGSGGEYGPPVVMGDESIMRPKTHGESISLLDML